MKVNLDIDRFIGCIDKLLLEKTKRDSWEEPLWDQKKNLIHGPQLLSL